MRLRSGWARGPVLGVVAAGALALPASGASTAPPLPLVSAPPAATISLSVEPQEAPPGDPLQAVVTLTGCVGAAVSLAGSYVDVAGAERLLTRTARRQGADWVVRLDLPDDAARTSLSDAPTTFTARADCTGSPRLASREEPVRVLPAGQAAVALERESAAPGEEVPFTVTDCLGGLVRLYAVGSDGSTRDVTDVDAIGTHAYAGSLLVPGSGDQSLVAECAQAETGSAELLVSGAGPVPVAPTPIRARPTFTG